MIEQLPVYNTGELEGPLPTVTSEVEYFGITKRAWLQKSYLDPG